MKNKFKLETMDLLPAIDEERELLIHNATYDMIAYITQYQIIYYKETGKFIMKNLYRNKYFHMFEEMTFTLNDETVTISQDQIIIDNGLRTICINRVNYQRSCDQIVELKENGWTHPLVDEWESICVFK